ncbi:hypothetical protein EVAR_37273_1 [Eumeta japonica]|uniref:Uncharacterized protein n=1 Tax=Eumeta variegata TaxID=151549 RepID=A0A4C1WMU1_EUMVA|nr:hypothetical protein EVAR_37273_1 [Eumeta japonica]
MDDLVRTCRILPPRRPLGAVAGAGAGAGAGAPRSHLIMYTHLTVRITAVSRDYRFPHSRIFASYHDAKDSLYFFADSQQQSFHARNMLAGISSLKIVFRQTPVARQSTMCGGIESRAEVRVLGAAGFRASIQTQIDFHLAPNMENRSEPNWNRGISNP